VIEGKGITNQGKPQNKLIWREGPTVGEGKKRRIANDEAEGNCGRAEEK
jgi:hypothetical protein